MGHVDWNKIIIIQLGWQVSTEKPKVSHTKVSFVNRKIQKVLLSGRVDWNKITIIQ